MSKPFHIGIFTGFKAPWSENLTRTWARSSAEGWTNGEYHRWMAQKGEEAGFDFVLIEDSMLIGDAYAGSYRLDLEHGCSGPRLDGIMLLPILGQATKHIGLIATMSTTFTPPYLLARLMATCDHLTNGRAGWNLVTSSQNRAAQNFGLELPPHDVRYDMAEEYIDLVNQLWASWEPDARVMDEDRGVYIDHTKVHPINFEGQFYKSRGPLTMMRPPQGRPVICQAGQSPKGIAFAGKHAEVVVANQMGVERMKTAREQTRERAAAAGRNPDHCKVMYIVSPIIEDTMEEARATFERLAEPTNAKIEMALGWLGSVTEVDFSKFDFDQPLPKVSTQGHQGILDEFLKQADGRTLRQLASTWNFNCVELVGTADSVASQMADVMEEVGGDGFLLSGPQNRSIISKYTDVLAPELKKRGLIRDSYSGATFRDNILAY